LKGTPLLIPECQGIITDQFQTPLSHIQILAHHHHIPSFAWKKTGDSAFQKYAGKWVKLSIGTDRFHLQEIKYSDYLKHKLKPTVSSVRLKSDIQSPELIQLSQCTKADQNKIGNKAYHFSILQKISHSNPDLFSVPAGSFAIPFYYYQQQIDQPVVRSKLQLICKQHPHWNRDHLSAELKKLRKLIRQQALNPALLQRIEQQIRSNQVGNSYRFRSSSNAEDAEGFSGAGLYKSATGIYGQTEKSIGQAIQKVWASTWSLQAFLAREQAGIRHEDVKMGILCHTNFGNEDANGVVVTKNIYRPSFSGYTANVQIGEISVVTPVDAVVCDQFTFFEASAFKAGQAPVAVDYITTGNQLGGRKVLTQEQITQLYKAVHACVTYYQRTLFSPHTFDIEFKFLNGKLYLKQIRPYD
jgi:phosphoenolpyruvate synthase/pyruvate phosphate dikinase